MTNEYSLSFQEVQQRNNLNHPNNPSIILLLDRISDPKNLGAIFRLADAAGVKDLYGYKMTIDPKDAKLDRIARQTNRLITFNNLDEVTQVKELAQSYHPIALEYTNLSKPYTAYKHNRASMLVLGNEQQGVSPELLEICQTSLHIPMLGQNSSMNVSMATGIVLYHLLENGKRI